MLLSSLLLISCSCLVMAVDSNNEYVYPPWSASRMFAVRLHLIRHGETEANQNHLVCGQSDSVSYHNT